MKEADKIAMCRALCSPMEGASDEVVSSYLKLAGQHIINRAYPFGGLQLDVPRRYEMLQCEIAVFLYTRRGAEGQTTHTEGDVSVSYDSGAIPESMLSDVIPHCEVM